ncbi:MAG: hypothetical protein WC881_10280 [Elusimicrobiota bacterium]|jgi:hypothetical protein
MPRLRTALFCLISFLPLSGSSQPGASAPFSKQEFSGLLQRFVDQQYLKSFARLGEESDFDHGHLLFTAGSQSRPIAILYHTQELSHYDSMDPRARNWLQWLDNDAIDDAARYERRQYPHSASWEWFVQVELGRLHKRNTVLDKMLDPALLGADISESRQWVFSRVACRPEPASESSPIRIVLPSGQAVCLDVSQS